MIDDIKISKALNILNELNTECRYDKICELTENQKENYKDLLNDFKKYNEMKEKDDKSLNQLKGKSLEELVSYLLQISGDLFLIYRNIRTKTNELDQFVKLTPKGLALNANNLVNSRLNNFLCECKNYNKNIDVTYTGKFCSLLLTTKINLGILFSFYGVSSSGWSNASGLIKKFYLHKEDNEKRYVILDFNYKDFESILQGKNFLQIIDDKILSLQLDTDYVKHISKHPAEEQIKNNPNGN